MAHPLSPLFKIINLSPFSFCFITFLGDLVLVYNILAPELILFREEANATMAGRGKFSVVLFYFLNREMLELIILLMHGCEETQFFFFLYFNFVEII